MPLYEYACRACGHEHEARQKFSDPPLTTCPNCGAESLERLISNSSFSLKGGGWYSDGYGPGQSSKDSEDSADKKDTASETSTDKKSEDKKSNDKKSDDKKSDDKKSSDKPAAETSKSTS